MENPFEPKDTRTPRAAQLLEIDAWLDSSAPWWSWPPKG
jgi:penicillin-binding protein 1A